MIISDPDLRAIDTKSARPNLASVAPIVRITTKNRISICRISPIKQIAEIASIKVVASSLKSVIKMWRRWMIVVNTVLRVMIYRKRGRNIVRIKMVTER